MIRERRSAARAIWHHLISLVEQVLFPEILQDPPYGFDVVILVSDVSTFQVHPVPYAVCQSLPFLDVCKSGFTAKRVEFLDAVRFDLLFIGETKFLFHLDLNRQAVGIPPAAARNMISTHGLIAREDILECARKHMMYTGFTVCGWRSFKENVLGFSFALRHALVKNISVLPVAQNLRFHPVYI